ncbi:MAG: hypothetical protein DCF25_08255, partial [Leptolyngbya foveolarum]
TSVRFGYSSMSTIAQSERRWQKEKILFFSLSFTKMHYHVLLALLGKAPGLDYEYQAVEVKEVAFRFDGVMRPAVESAS